MSKTTSFARSRVKRLDPLDCSWAVLTLPETGRPSREAMAFEFERYLPRPIEEYRCDFMTIGNNRIVAIAALNDSVRDATREHDQIRPPAVPAFICEAAGIDLDPSRFELARGVFRSGRRRRLDMWSMSIACLVLLSVSSLLTIGMVRRASRAETTAGQIESLTRSTYNLVLPEDTPANQPRSILVQGLLRQARQASDAAAGLDLPDASRQVESILAAWPSMPELRVRQIGVDKQQCTIDVLLSIDADAAEFLGVFGGMPGWRAGSPSVRRTGDTQRVTLRLTRAAPEPAS